jgi:DNA-binding NarL/FixJ family response regulator
MKFPYLSFTDMKIFVVEDSAAVRERLVEMIREIAGVEVVGEADGFDAAVSGILDTRPDVAIVDIHLAQGTGIEVFATVRRELPALRGVMLTHYTSPQHRKASADAGAEYFLDKSADFERIGEILRKMNGPEGSSDRYDPLSE